MNRHMHGAGCEGEMNIGGGEAAEMNMVRRNTGGVKGRQLVSSAPLTWWWFTAPPPTPPRALRPPTLSVPLTCTPKFPLPSPEPLTSLPIPPPPSPKQHTPSPASPAAQGAPAALVGELHSGTQELPGVTATPRQRDLLKHPTPALLAQLGGVWGQA